MVNAISRQVLDLWNRYKPTIAVDAIKYDGELKKLLGTDLAKVGTDCISRQSAIDAFNTNIDELVVAGKENADAVERYLNRVIDEIKQLPPIQPEIVRCKDCKYWINGSCEYREYAVNCEDYRVGDMETEAEHFCGYAERREVTT